MEIRIRFKGTINSTFCNALNPKSDTLRFPMLSRSRFSGYNSMSTLTLHCKETNAGWGELYLEISMIDPFVMAVVQGINELLEQFSCLTFIQLLSIRLQINYHSWKLKKKKKCFNLNNCWFSPTCLVVVLLIHIPSRCISSFLCQ